MGDIRFRSKCKGCSRVYSLDSSNEEFCSQCQSHRNLQKDCKPNMTCKKCSEKYYSPNHMKNCPCCSVKGYACLNKRPKTYDNEKLVQKAKKKGLPLEVLIKMMEHKRLFDDSGWDHYLKGRKWDRI